MPVDTRINIPFIPQEGITAQILSAIQMANEQHFHQQQIGLQQQQTGIQQQQANTAASKAPSEIEEAKARTGLYGVQAQHQQVQLDNMRRTQQMFDSPVDTTQLPKGQWLPTGTPQHLAPLLSPMIPKDLTEQEKNVIEAGAREGQEVARNSGNMGDYYKTVRQGIDSIATARNATMKPEGERALGSDRVDQLNQGMQARWQVLNPGQDLPKSFILPATATQKDFEHTDKLLEAVEKAHGVKAQQDTANAMHQETLRLQKENAGRKDSDFIDKNYVKPANDTEKSYQMFVDAYNNRNDAKTGAESMLALSTHLNTTFGNVKGARVTKDMIQEHLGARSVSDSAQVAVQKLSNGDVLSQDQWDAFKGLITQSRNLSWQTVQKEAKRRDVDVSGSLPADLKGGKAGGGLSPEAAAYLKSQGVPVP